jgi:5-methylcytosine-specific restriction endonuclease McrA
VRLSGVPFFPVCYALASGGIYFGLSMSEKYNEYLQGEHWQETRKRYYHSKLFRKTYKKRCGICLRDVPLDLHHKTYKRIGAEPLKDLIGVCRECHTQIHSQVTNSKAVGRETKRLKKRMRKWIRKTFWDKRMVVPNNYALPKFIYSS